MSEARILNVLFLEEGETLETCNAIAGLYSLVFDSKGNLVKNSFGATTKIPKVSTLDDVLAMLKQRVNRSGKPEFISTSRAGFDSFESLLVAIQDKQNEQMLQLRALLESWMVNLPTDPRAPTVTHLRMAEVNELMQELPTAITNKISRPGYDGRDEEEEITTVADATGCSDDLNDDDIEDDKFFVSVMAEGTVMIEDEDQDAYIYLDALQLRRLIDRLVWAESALSLLEQ